MTSSKKVCIDAAAHTNYKDAITSALRMTPSTIVLIGEASAVAPMAKEAEEKGHQVEILPAGSKCPDDALYVSPVSAEL